MKINVDEFLQFTCGDVAPGMATIQFEYRWYLDAEQQIIGSDRDMIMYMNPINGIKTDDKVYNPSEFGLLILPEENRIIALRMVSNKRIFIQREHVILFILENIDQFHDIIKILKTGDDNLLFAEFTTDEENPISGLDLWQDRVSKKFSIPKSKTHNIVLTDTMSPMDLIKDAPPDFLIVKSQRDDITLERIV